MATAQRGRSRSCALVYSSDRPDPKIFIIGCSLAPPSKKAQIETDNSLLSRTITGTTCKMLNGKAARLFTSHNTSLGQLRFRLAASKLIVECVSKSQAEQ